MSTEQNTAFGNQVLASLDEQLVGKIADEEGVSGGVVSEPGKPLRTVEGLDPEEIVNFLNDASKDANARQVGMDALFEEDDSTFDAYTPEPLTRTNTNANKMDAITSAALVGDNSYDAAIAIKQELDASGESSFLTNAKYYLASDTDANRKSFVQSQLNDPTRTADENADLIRGYLDARSVGTKLRDEFVQRLSILDNSQTEEEALVQDVVPEVLPQRMSVEELKTQQENRIAVTLDPTLLGVVGDMSMLMLPFMEQRMVTKIKAELGMENSWMEAFFTGEGKQSIADAMLRMKREDVHEMYTRLADSISNNTNILGVENGLVKSYMLQELLGDEGYPTYLRVIDNSVALLDIIGVGWAAKSVAKRVFGGVRSGTPSALAAAANQRVAAKELAEALDDETNVIADALGIERTDVVSEVMPKPVGIDITGAPDSVVKEVERMNKGADELLARTGSQRLVYSTEEIEATNKSSFEYLESITGVKFRLGMSTFSQAGAESVARSDTGFTVNALFGANDVSGWRTLGAAKRAASASFGKDQPIEFFVRNPATDEIVSVSSKEGKIQNVVNNGDYYVQYKYDQQYDKTIAGVFGSDAVTRIGSLPKAGKYLQDATSRFNKLIRGGALTYTDQIAGAEIAVMRDVKRNFEGLKESSKAKLLEAIEEGSTQETRWSYNDLVTKFGMDDTEAVAMMSFGRAQDTLWSLQNREVFKDLRSKRMDSLYLGNTDTGMFARRMDDEEITRVFGQDTTLPVYNPKTNDVGEATWDDIVALYERDGSVVQLNQSVYVKNNKYSYVLAESTPKKGSTATLKPLTRSPLSYKEGYYQRFYEDPYMVRKVYKHGKVNGKSPARPTEETLYAASDLTSAKAIRDRLIAEHVDDDTVDFKAVRGRDLTDENRETADWEQLTRSGLLSARNRGERLGSIEGLAKIQDPLQSLVRASRAVSQKVGLGEWMEVMRQRWTKSYPDLAKEGKMPSSVEAIQEAGRAAGAPKQKVNEAVAIFEYMKMMENTPTKLSKKWQGTALDIAEAVEGKSRLAAAGVRAASDFNPTQAIKTTAYKTFIALNPLRQMLIQPSQLLQMINIDGKYVLSGRMAKDIAALSVGMEGQTKIGAKMMGVPQKEYDAMLKSFKDGGMPYAIDQHQFLEAAVVKADQTLSPQPGIVRAAKAPIHGVKRAYAFSKTIGFDAGEYTNIAGHWLVAQRRYMKQNPDASMKSQKSIDEIGLLARELSYSMNRAGKLGHQGYPTSAFSEVLSVPLQFFSIPHKAFLSVTSSKVYTKGEKYRLAALNLGLFGAAGIPAMSLLIDEAKMAYGIDVSDKEWVAIKGGLVDWGLSTAINAAFQDPEGKTDYFQIAKQTAPGGGGLTPIANLYEGITRNNMAKPLFGASYNVGSRVWQGAQQMADIVTEADWSTSEKMSKGLETLLSITGGGSNYFKSQFAFKHHKMMSSKGQTTVDTGSLGATMKLFGIPTYAEANYYSLVISMADMRKDINSDVDRFYDSHVALAARGLQANDWKLENEMRQGLFNLYDDPQARQIALDRFNQRSDMARSNNGESLAYKVAEMVAYPSGDMSDAMRNSLHTSMAISPENRMRTEEMIKNITKAHESEGE